MRNHSFPKHTNALINESSPYLLRHAHNPVHWHAWVETALQMAKEQNKALLISIGYSACHWCHVMEKESFEDESVAEIMNKNFICIKVDREERPDIDQVYMEAVQLMTGQGGWPLNCFALPDGRPFYGGTYFKKQQWIDILTKLADLTANQPQKVEDYAKKLTEGIRENPLFKFEDSSKPFDFDLLDQMVKKWQLNFDLKEGGY